MTETILIVTIILFTLIMFCAMLNLYKTVVTELVELLKKVEKADTPATPQMSEEDYKKFVENDAEQTQAALNALSSLNAFMTGSEEEINAEQQDT